MPSFEDTCLVLATYNEASNLTNLIPRLLEIVPGARIIVVDDNSPDGTPDLLARFATEAPRVVPLVRPGKQGYGSAVLAGFRKALELGAAKVVTMDSDFSHDPESVPQLIEALDHADISIGSRYFQGVRILNWHVSRLLLSLFANRYVKTILGFKVEDATSGFRAYRRPAIEAIVAAPLRSQGYSFLVEILYGAHRKGFSMIEVPIIYAERREGQSKMSKGVIMEAVFRPWNLRFRALLGLK
ncbi:MAG: polyprenol monophosphomannose synthase [Candidatus Sumerlaeaceae bacterium]|nr:polyprenol monophosphomannose synthase [Candidatus Sumerlaeaceae bacterium]